MQSKDSKVYSVIDIGTNTCLLLIAQLTGKSLATIFEDQETPRLGKDLYKTGQISKDVFQTTLKIIKKYISISKGYKAERILAFGTSALREANNNIEFVEFIESECGIKIKILSGEEEARYGYEGATFDFDENRDYAVLDIGGGSTEISLPEDGRIISFSMDIGSVRIHEMFFKEVLDSQSIENAKKFINKIISRRDINFEIKLIIGIAGTLTTISAIKNNLKEFDKNVIHKDVLTISEIKYIFSKLISIDEGERLALGRFMEGRSDIIISGTLILIEVMTHFKVDSIIVSTKGLRYGLLLHITDFHK